MTDTTDAQRAEDARQFLAVWTGGKHLSDEHREDFIAAWTGWHRGADFQRECDERDAKAAIGSYVSALAVERAELAAALADARKLAPAPLNLPVVCSRCYGRGGPCYDKAGLPTPLPGESDA